ncbi:hypothetical protein CHS0354_015615 [Potamilus streckersoni]|uniref:SOCS box domain-containing protein n=1 Tax=Potamilus streckersoni TaxID=2493646 RepID=A0AAE0TC15_9BIVA|nr:hypothetical protein CHS0354_015615 [Potamilus streckersoni]
MADTVRSMVPRDGQTGRIGIRRETPSCCGGTLSSSYNNAMDTLKGLHEAIIDNDVDVVCKLLQEGADVNSIYNQETAFSKALAVGNDIIISKIINFETFDPNQPNRAERSPLFNAALRGRNDVVRVLISLGAIIDQRDYQGVTPLGATAYYNHGEAAELLIQHGADVNSESNNGETPLYRACANVSDTVVEVLLRYNCDVNKKPKSNHSQNRTPFMEAVPSKYQEEVQGKQKSKMLDIMKLLIAQGCDINAQDSRGNTALHYAIERTETLAVCLLAECGADLHLLEENGLSSFEAALSHSEPRYEIATYLLAYGFEIERCLANKPREDVKAAWESLLKTITLAPTSVRAMLLPLTIQSAPLFHQFSYEEKDKFKCLNEQEQEIVLRYFHKECPPTLEKLCRKVIRRHIRPCILRNIDTLPITWSQKRFLAYNFCYKSHNPLKLYELQLAIQEGNHKMAEQLLNIGLDLNTAITEQTPLTVAAIVGDIEMVKLLLKHGANPLVKDNQGQTAFHVASRFGHIPVLEVLFSHGVDVDIPNIQCETGLVCAAAHGKFETVLFLLSKGANPNKPNHSGIFPIHYAAGSGNDIVTSSIIENGGDIHVLDALGNTPLHVAASRGQMYTANNINLPYLYKSEVLMHFDAIKLMASPPSTSYFRENVVKHLDVIEILISAGADKASLTNDMLTPFKVAEKYRFFDSFVLLQ